ncbi:hypothetical protein [Nannocystis radixulma]|uniref:Myxococcus cysteine-rich repeat-containing protein n=1 Tax=Nannocystis radixulma TaxID=2995305 RepID=A0ABT5B0G7_9BACT|nr:hypothetical protein [Nannocystis radixulma]MDC0667594.1 hypothetical protein [Nannocystis radixulma]
MTGTPSTQTMGSTVTEGGSMSATDTDTGGSNSATMTGVPTTGTPTGTTTTTTGDPTETSTGDSTTEGVQTSTTTTTGPQVPMCGNGLLEMGEECDDGNVIDKDACSNACTKVPCEEQEGVGELLSYIWIANSTQNTVSKINTFTGVEEGRYYVEGGSPSRTSVNLLGDVAVSSRDPGGVTKIAARKIDCVDLNGNGMIDTSTGPNNILPLGTDECVLWRKPIPSPGYTYGARATAWEGTKPDPDTCQYPQPRLWFGWMDAQNTAHIERVDGTTGATLDTVLFPNWGPGYSPYGGAVNADGDFFVTGLSTQPAIMVDAETLAVTNFGVPQGCKYGMTLDKNGNIWNGGCNDNSVYLYDMQTQAWSNIGNAGGSRVNGMMADGAGNVWGAGSSPCRLVHIDADSKTYVNNNIPIPGCSNPWGVSIDIEGFVWVVDMSANVAFKIDPVTYQTVLTVTGLVGPYTYSDMTGAALNAQINPQ